jgi:NAD(P)-dependent dehydrogenase (short-subunit alcohol dehydrogenase family)
MTLSGKAVVLTGASGALGRAMAIALAGAGARVIGTGRNVERGEETARLVKAAGGDVVFLSHDVTADDDWQRVLDATLSRCGRIDAVINNAGDARLRPIEELALEDLEYVLRLNLEGSFLGLQHAFRRFGPEGGAVINVTVLTAYGGNAGSTAYSAAKGALAHLTKAAALAGRARRIRVNNIVPGVLFEGGELSAGAIRVHGGPEGAQRFKDRIVAKTPLKRLGEPQDAAAAAVYLCSDAARHVSGIDLVVDGGRLAGGN